MVNFVLMHSFNHKKSIQALTLFAQKEGGAINKMKAIKLLWLCDRFHLRKYGRTISGDNYVAMKLGPVASNTRDILEQSTFLSEEESEYSNLFINVVNKYNYSVKAEPNLKVFSKSDLNTFEEVYNVYGHLTHFELSRLSHLFPEWQKFESALKTNNSSRYDMIFEDFFKNTQNENPLFEDDDENLELVKKIYLRQD